MLCPMSIRSYFCLNSPKSYSSPKSAATSWPATSCGVPTKPCEAATHPSFLHSLIHFLLNLCRTVPRFAHVFYCSQFWVPRIRVILGPQIGRRILPHIGQTPAIDIFIHHVVVLHRAIDIFILPLWSGDQQRAVVAL